MGSKLQHTDKRHMQTKHCSVSKMNLVTLFLGCIYFVAVAGQPFDSEMFSEDGSLMRGKSKISSEDGSLMRGKSKISSEDGSLIRGKSKISSEGGSLMRGKSKISSEDGSLMRG